MEEREKINDVRLLFILFSTIISDFD